MVEQKPTPLERWQTVHQQIRLAAAAVNDAESELKWVREEYERVRAYRGCKHDEQHIYVTATLPPLPGCRECNRLLAEAIAGLKTGKRTAEEWRAVLGVDFSPTPVQGIVWTGTEDGIATFQVATHCGCPPGCLSCPH